MIQILHYIPLVDLQVITVILLKNQEAPVLLVILQGQLDTPLPNLTLRQTVLDPLWTWPFVIADEDEDSPLCPPGQNLDVIDLSKDTDMDMIQPESSNLEERRKRKANDIDIDTYRHPYIEFEATGKILLNLFFLNPTALLCVVTSDIITLSQHMKVL